MAVSIVCPNCSKQFALKEELAGRTVKCGCGAKFVVSQGSEAHANEASSGLFDELAAHGLQASGQPHLQAANPYQSPLHAPSYLSAGGQLPLTPAQAIRAHLARWWKTLAVLSAAWILLVVVFGVATFAYLASHPGSGVRAADRATSFGSGLGVFAGLGLGAIWLPFVFYARFKRQ